MNDLINKTVEKYRSEIIEFSDLLFKNPELGYKEFKTKELIINKSENNNEFVDSNMHKILTDLHKDLMK